MKHLVIVRGGGELASGTIHALFRAGFRVLVLEKKEPSATRRRVAYSEAMYRGQAKVERITCYKAENLHEAKARLKKGELVMLEDPEARCVKELKPQVLVDAILSHDTNGTTKDMAEHTIALGPGFCAGRDVDVVVETMRGHNLGRLIYEGYSARSQDIESSTVGVSANMEHLIFAPEEGTVDVLSTISLMVKKGEPLAQIHTPDGRTIEMKATIDGVLRGALHRGSKVKKDQKIADIHPTMGQEECFTISDKARCVAGSVLEAVMVWEHKRPKRRFFGRG
ncbi:selenium-dependent molybdenum cofactor biosynthesis protein YqeB [Selenomonas ruminantium]|uniref:Xanthine dehydrogenase accessory factor n=1 Tax=Selenomonas ruminantium TaxID=971 RepID=A0A1H0QZZ7_SELRU|nr:selenium-dependent molybdenum cofactor biosynthesis protein YqeB [Selenomonas ruminantium]SDP22834.1 xanthine dehydrogenase accessory factor [Selenomonas ruminantium]